MKYQHIMATMQARAEPSISSPLDRSRLEAPIETSDIVPTDRAINPMVGTGPHSRNSWNGTPRTRSPATNVTNPPISSPHESRHTNARRASHGPISKNMTMAAPNQTAAVTASNMFELGMRPARYQRMPQATVCIAKATPKSATPTARARGQRYTMPISRKMNENMYAIHVQVIL